MVCSRSSVIGDSARAPTWAIQSRTPWPTAGTNRSGKSRAIVAISIATRAGLRSGTGSSPTPTRTRRDQASAAVAVVRPPSRKQSSQSHSSGTPASSTARTTACSSSGGCCGRNTTPTFTNMTLTMSRMPTPRRDRRPADVDGRPRTVDGAAAAARRRAREAEIVAATRRLFDDNGVREAHIDDIARAVGVNRAIVYRHFTGKEDLFALTMVSYLVELAELLDKAARKARTPETRLAAVVTTFADYGLEHPAFVDCAQALMRRPGSELLDEVSERALLKLGGGMAACLRSLSGVIEDGVATGDFKVKDATLLANTLYASGLGALMLARSGLVISESAPGVPVVGEISADQVKQYMVATALRARPGPAG